MDLRQKMWFVAICTVFALAALGGSRAAEPLHSEGTLIPIYPTGGIEKYCVPGEYLDERLAIIVGFPSLSKSDISIRASVKCLISLWPIERNEPGASGVSNGLLALLYLSPQIVIDEMSSHPKILDQWMRQLPILSFSWSDKGSCGFDTYREQLLSVLASSKGRIKNEALRSKIAIRMSSIRCHIID